VAGLLCLVSRRGKVVIPLIFLSTLLRQNVVDIEGRRLGTVYDVYVSPGETFPSVTALVVRPALNANNTIVIPWSQIRNLEESPIFLKVRQAQIIPYTPQPEELLLKRDILDKQIVDTQGIRVVKVNDLKLAQIKGTARLIGVDISLSGLLRRLGLQAPLEWVSRVLPVRLSDRTITWNYVEPIQVVNATASEQLEPALAGAGAVTGTAVSVGASGVVPQVQLSVSHTRLADLHPADIADILEQLDAQEAGAVLQRLDTETAADTLSEVELPRQAEILSGLDAERASRLLAALAPDDVADLLAELPREEAERLLGLLPAEESRQVRDLLHYDSRTAGGLMTTRVLGLPQEFSVEETLAYLRTHADHLETIYYLYVVDEEQRLVGVVSLRSLVTADPQARLRDLLNPDVIHVHTDTDQEEVARLISRYDLLAIPVLDEEGRLVGLITVDDVIDVIHEEQAEDLSEIAGTSVEEFKDEEEQVSWRAVLSRITWLAVNVAAGFVLALLLNALLGPALHQPGNLTHAASLLRALRSPTALTGVVCLLPLLLLTSGSIGSQALGVAGWQLRSTRGRDFWRGFFRELQLGTAGGVLSSISVSLLTWALFHSLLLGLAVGLGLGLTLLLAAILGLLLPTLFYRLRLRGSLLHAPLLDPIIAVLSVVIFLGITLPLLTGPLYAG
jgi:magnesium transporter